MSENYYEAVYRLTREIPRGRVATYGQIADEIAGCHARMVGYALSALGEGTDVPWQRVVNRLGEVSERGFSDGHVTQRGLLEAEGIVFGDNQRIDLKQYRYVFGC